MKLKINQLVNNTGQIEGLPANPRQIDKTDYERLLKSLKEDPDFLVHKPLHVYEHNDKYIVLGGNQRLRALKELGYKEVPVTVYEPETPVDVLKRRIIIDNSTFGDYDMEMLGNEWSDEPLTDWGVDLPEDWLGADDGEVEEDEAPEVSDEPPVSKLGEVYQLGRHRIMCGDSKTDKSKLLDIEIDMVLTDPPYNIGYADIKGKFDSIANDKMSDEDFVEFLKDTLNVEADTFYVCCSWQYSHLFRQSMEEIGKPVKAFIVWNKVNPAQNLDKYFKAHEIILYSGKFGGQKTLRSDVWEVKREKNTDHPTMKPIELLSYALVDTPEAKTVYDPFLGSGSTLIACEQTDRTCYGMELDPRYVDVIRKRYWKYVNNNNEEGWQENTPAIEEK